MFSIIRIIEFNLLITKEFNLFEWPDERQFGIFRNIDIIINKFWPQNSIIKLKFSN